MVRIPAVILGAVLLAVAATLHLRVTPVPPPNATMPALLFPAGDAPGGLFDQDKTLYIAAGGDSVRYATIAAFGRAVLTTNTSGWYVALAKEVLPPAVVAAELPAAGEYITTTLKDGSILEVYNLNGTHGAVLRGVSGHWFAWAAEIVETGGYYVWYPIASAEMKDLIASRTGRRVALLMPSPDYMDFDGRLIYIYTDTKTAYVGISVQRQLNATTQFYADGLEWVGDVNIWIYWPVVAAYWGGEATYLRAEGRR